VSPRACRQPRPDRRGRWSKSEAAGPVIHEARPRRLRRGAPRALPR
jgi:hypothetical protein